MFPNRLFPHRFWTARYWPKVGAPLNIVPARPEFTFRAKGESRVLSAQQSGPFRAGKGKEFAA